MKNLAILLGMPRAATTFMYHHFDSHPRIFVPFRRKSNYFSLHFNTKSDDWFYNHFGPAKANQVAIDTETLGFFDQNIDVIDRIKQVLPEECKFIMCVREPGEWAHSLYKQILTFDNNPVSFEDFLHGKYILTEDDIDIPFNYNNGDIKKRIEELKNAFGERLLLIDYKNIQKDPNEVLISIENFLELESYYRLNPVSNEKINASDKKHIRFVSYILRNKYLINLLSYLPTQLVKKVRKFYDSKLTKNSLKTKGSVCEEVLSARRHFSVDVEYYNSLFK